MTLDFRLATLTPWLTGICDQQGRFSFTPDPDLPGTWDVQVRQAGHGDIIHIPVGAEHEFKNTGDGEFIYLSFKNKSEDWPPPTATMD